MGKVYAIEHMEPDEETPSKPLPEWVLLEYFHMLQQVGIVGGKEDAKLLTRREEAEDHETSPTESKVFFSHLSQPTCEALFSEINTRASSVSPGSSSIAGTLPDPSSSAIAENDLPPCVCTRLSILDLMKRLDVGLEEVCLLDPKAEQELKPEDGGKFRWFLFGGILGDDPPRDRTAQLRVCGFPSRHLGPIQMTTDTALAVTKRVVEDRHTLDQLPWTVKPELVFSPKEKVEMPFRYLASPDGQPIMPDGMKELIHKDLDRAFEF
ncbi:uncharacterized protein PGTG_15183 [Puccinia graminis f. sp. tritici CRL 75-36-700-3]|uniref:DUF431-domain-containing protein n=1 Tax=Puccinia graminis f. sp. tritici (strain CRL 75-36-700-3 / race SCCL) TaxID=418459 RepID=E3KXA7_PUCGT|nr:uncharacterized protein PGTG_15183 [Puccinia graminis f. sp. tritici CRL 75-36-700-3]EFP88980.1 hypothetical protein PGTG_15183 [Puccinia graminis f. sp. tritici CRL 75-36-700-3]